MRIKADVALAMVMLCAAVILYATTSPMAGDFYWSDTSQHAMNGALIQDYIAFGPWRSPMQFAFDYYLHFPAITIAMYPPIFPMVEAIVFALAGFSHVTAQLTVTGFTALGVFYFYRICRTAMPPLGAAGATLLLLSMPVIALWSRQVMLEMPTLALLLAAMFHLLRHFESGRAGPLILATILIAGAICTKQTAAFAVPVFAVAIITERGWRALGQRLMWLAAALGFVLLLPYGIYTVMFAWHNLALAGGIGTEAAKVGFSSKTLVWYAKALPDISGLAPLGAAALYIILLAARGPAGRAERRLALLMIAWFVIDYLFITPFAHREVRYGFFLAPAVAALAGLLISRLLPPAPGAWLTAVAGALAFSWTLVASPVPRVGGYEAVARYVLARAPKDTVVLFHGLHSPNFVFALRAAAPAPKFYVLRAEKLLVDYQIVREWGINDRNMTEADIAAMVDRYGIEYIVLQLDFWTDQPSVARLQAYMQSDRFEVVATFPIIATEPRREMQILALRNRTPTYPKSRSFELMIPAIGVTVQGGS